MTQENGHSNIKRFSGDVDQPAKEYLRWKRWSRAFLVVQKAKGTPEEAYGSLLYTLLDGSALRAFDEVNMDDLEQAGGEQGIYSVLDGRFPEDEAHDKVGEVLDRVFDLKVQKGENTASFTGRAREIFSRSEGEGIPFPSIAKGYMLLRAAKLPSERKAVVLAASRRSYDDVDVPAALRTTYPDNLSAISQRVHLAESSAAAHEDEEVETLLADAESDELTKEVSECLAAMNQVEEGDEPIEEADAIHVLATWKQTREKIGQAKLQRGFGPPKPNLHRIQKRVRCFRCKKIGHFLVIADPKASRKEPRRVHHHRHRPQLPNRLECSPACVTTRAWMMRCSLALTQTRMRHARPAS